MQSRGWTVLMLFFCSGATALVYEVLWSKFLSQMFGSTIYAQTVVLAAFMGGLALGNRIFGRWADTLRHPVQAYGILECLIGLYALLFTTLDRAANYLFIAMGTPIAEQAGLLLVLKGVLSIGLLLGPTILMGGTLPLMAGWLQKSSTDAGRRSALFYSVNSLGAVLGSALAGFWLVQQFGMLATLYMTAAANIIIGTAAILISRSGWLGQSVSADAVTMKTSSEVSTPPETLRWAGLIVALTGGVSMGLEVLASRSVALIFGPSLQSFAIVLIAFILGIGLGSAWIASARRASNTSEKLVVLLLCMAAGWVTFLVFNIERWVDFYRIARTGLSHSEIGYTYHLLLSSGISLVILGIPAALIGAVLPLMIRALSGEGAPLGAKVGMLLTWNTLGAVAGTLLTGFVLMPQAGLRNAFGILALMLGLAALMVALRRWRPGIIVAVGVCIFSGCLFIFSDGGWRFVISSGIFRLRESRFEPGFMALRREHMKILFYEDAADATVTVEQVDDTIVRAALSLRINGKADAGTLIDMGTQFLTAHLPMLVKPDAKDVFVLGLGSGITAGAVLAYPVDNLVVAENCEPVIRAAEFFSDWNRHVLKDPRTHMWAEDARTVLKLRPQLYDVIITVPSNPWTAGIGSVFSREYYELAASRLKPGGIVAQWFQAYEINDDILRLMLRTFSSIFPFVEVWDAGAGDLVMLGSLQPWQTGTELFRRGFGIDRVRTDMAMIDIQSPEALLSRQLASQRTGFAIAGDGPVQSDMFPVLEYAAPKAFFIGAGTRVLERYDERTHQQLLAPIEKREALHSLPTEKLQLAFTYLSTINGQIYGCVFGTTLGVGVPCVFQTPAPQPPPAVDGSIYSEIARAFDAGALDQARQLVDFALLQNPRDEQALYLARIVEREKQLRQSAGQRAAAH